MIVGWIHNEIDVVSEGSVAMNEEPISPTVALATKQPPPEKPEAISLRTKIILSFWAVILFLGLPTWWQTTSIYRASLPLQDMVNWAEGTVRTPDWIRVTVLIMRHRTPLPRSL